MFYYIFFYLLCLSILFFYSTMLCFFFFFFFSSRRRHTRLQGDWSSDVCSSDLELPGTTRDATDIFYESDGRKFIFIDTAGMRRRGKHSSSVEVFSVMRAERSEEHTSELQSPCNLVCRLLLEKKK